MKDNIFRIVPVNSSGEKGSGTGFLITPTSILTCAHVVLGDIEVVNGVSLGLDDTEKWKKNLRKICRDTVKSIEIHDKNDEKLFEAKLTKINPDYDMAILEIDETKIAVPNFNNSVPAFGDILSFLGYLLTKTENKVEFKLEKLREVFHSVVKTKVSGLSEFDHLALTEVIPSGFSGGPLFNEKEEIIAVVNGNIPKTLGGEDYTYGAAIPIGLKDEIKFIELNA